MRDIEFRAWDKAFKKMVTIEDDLPLYYEPDNGLHAGYSLPNGDWNSLELMQYTGLKDKNGKKIFEGDVVRILICKGMVEKFRSEVSFYEGSFMIACENYQESLSDYEQSQIEIIGNKYENPELLK